MVSGFFPDCFCMCLYDFLHVFGQMGRHFLVLCRYFHIKQRFCLQGSIICTACSYLVRKAIRFLVCGNQLCQTAFIHIPSAAVPLFQCVCRTAVGSKAQVAFRNLRKLFPAGMGDAVKQKCPVPVIRVGLHGSRLLHIILQIRKGTLLPGSLNHTLPFFLCQLKIFQRLCLRLLRAAFCAQQSKTSCKKRACQRTKSNPLPLHAQPAQQVCQVHRYIFRLFPRILFFHSGSLSFPTSFFTIL